MKSITFTTFQTLFNLVGYRCSGGNQQRNVTEGLQAFSA